MAFILNKAQSEAIISAFAALNNVNMKLKAEIVYFDGDFINCFERPNGSIKVNRVCRYLLVEEEIFTSQADFIEAYELMYKE